MVHKFTLLTARMVVLFSLSTGEPLTFPLDGHRLWTAVAYLALSFALVALGRRRLIMLVREGETQRPCSNGNVSVVFQS